MTLLNFHNQLMRVKKIDTVKVDAAQFEFGEGLSVEEIGSWWVKRSIIQTKAQNRKRQSGKTQRRAAALKIKKIIRRCKADTKTIKRLDDEQKELLERMRKHL